MYRNILSIALVSLAAPGAWAQAQGGVVPAPGVPPTPGQAVEAEVGVPMPGERIDPELIPAGVVESMQVVIERERENPRPSGILHRARNGAQGSWIVPTRKSTYRAHSGEHYATNKWGDTRMGIAFGEPVDVAGAWVAGQYEQPVWATGLFAVGFRAGEEVGRTDVLESLGTDYRWFAMDLENVDRIELRAQGVLDGAGFYALDDLTFTPRDTETGAALEAQVLTFDDLPWRFTLTGSDYAGLTWETGTGDFQKPGPEVVHDPKSPPGHRAPEQGGDDGGAQTALLGGGGTLPAITDGFAGPSILDAGAGWIPPDTCGAVGMTQYISVVNQHMSVYDKQTHTRLVNVSLQNFFNTGGSAGDPRVVYDHFEERWVVIASNFSSFPSGCYIAYSMSDDATGNWFKGFIPFSSGSDSGNWCDYPTLGIDQHGIYMGAYMVGGNFLMSLFAVDKAPLLAGSPSIGTVTAWRQLAWEGALQGCVTHGTPAGEYVVSRRSNTQLRIRRVNPPLSAPTLTELGNVVVSFGGAPPAAPAMGSTVPLSTVGPRLMNAVYRNGSVWTAHTIRAAERASARWYELDPIGMVPVQIGLVRDDVNHYFFPAIAVNALGHAVLGFTGSSPVMFAGTWYTGRLASDPAGEMAPPVEAHAGLGAYNQANSGTNRWGDYSLSNVDPENDLDLWTIQEYARNNNRWGTWINRFEFPTGCVGGASNYCTAAPTSTTSGAVMAQTGSLSFGDNGTVIEVSNAPVNKPGLFYYGPAQIQTPFGDGFRCVGAGGVGTFRLYPLVQTDGAGAVSRPLDFT
ncbi:MAG: hypothetical protein ACI8QZ_003923, partial [Chlamydiales bacterium]